MPFVDLGAQRAQRAAQILQMMNEMRARSGKRPSALDELNKEYEELKRKRAEEARQERDLESTLKTRQGGLDIQGWSAGRKEIHDAEDAARAEELARKQKAHIDAQTEASRASAGASRQSIEESKARTGKVELETEGERKDQKTKATEQQINRARDIENDAIRRLSMGETLTVADTDALQDARRLLTGNPSYTIPRKPDGVWDAPKNVARGMLDKSGIPTTKYGEGIEKIERPKSKYGQLVDDALDARERSHNDPYVMALYEDKFFKENALNRNQLEWRMSKKFIDAGDYEGASKIIGGLAQIKSTKANGAKLPSVEERQEFARQARLVKEMDDMQKEFDRLVNDGKMPVGALKQPFYKLLSIMEGDNPEVTSFIKKVEQMKGEYLLYLSGRAATDAERDDLNNRIPTIFDSPQTFRMSLPQFKDKVTEDMSIDAGILHSFGLKAPEGIPILDPGTIMKRDGKLPDLILDSGYYIPGDMAARQVQGIGIIGGNGSVNVGGTGEFRQKTAPSEQLGESTEFPSAAPSTLPAPTKLDPIERNTLQREADDLERQLGIK